MLAKAHRFHGHRALDYTYRRGNTVRVDLLSLRYVPAKGKDYRVAVVVSKKVQKSAVIRNRIRRRIYEVIRELDRETELPAQDMIFTVFSDQAAEISPAALRQKVKKLIEKSQLQDKNPGQRTGS